MPPTLINPVFSEVLAKRPRTATRLADEDKPSLPIADCQERDRSSSPVAKKVKWHKPANLTKLKSDGSNYTVWASKIKAAMRHVGLKTDVEIDDPDCDQLGRDILVDVVEDGLVRYVDPPGLPTTTFEVMTLFREMFGETDSSFHGSLISQLWQLSQKPGEDIQSYGSRSSALLDKLVRGGGDFPPSTFLQCFCRGLADEFQIKVDLMEQGPPARKTFPCFMGSLLAAEAKLEHRASIKKQLFHGAAGAVTETPKRTWKPNPKAAAAPAAKGRRPHNPNCWNCNKPGHGSRDCPQPQVRPWPFAPEGFQHKRAEVDGAAAPKPAAT
jgi:hypothetical protein